jgi:hypothetical protein
LAAFFDIMSFENTDILIVGTSFWGRIVGRVREV